LSRGQQALLIVVLTTAVVLTPLILGGVLLGYYVGDTVGYSKSVLAITFSTVGFVAGMVVIFRVIRAVVARTDRATD
jgi:F0F1-type ATP synthase assembly protein I